MVLVTAPSKLIRGCQFGNPGYADVEPLAQTT